MDDPAEGDIKNLHPHGRVQPAVERFIAGEKKIGRDHRQFISGFIGRTRVKNTAAGAAEHEQGDQQTGGVQLHKRKGAGQSGLYSVPMTTRQEFI